jgi:hypothetical protein
MIFSYGHSALAAACFAASLLFVSCGSPHVSSGNPESETDVMLSGAVTGSFTGRVVSVWDSTSDYGSFIITIPDPSPLGSLQVDITQPGEPLAGTFTDTDAGAKSAILVQQTGSRPPSWVMVVNGNQQDQGAYMLTFTSVAVQTDAGKSRAYSIHGTLDATLPAQSGTGATGIVALYASF